MRLAIFGPLVGLLAAAGLSEPARADGMRCGNRLITPGDHEARVLRYCGEPISVESRYAQRLYAGDFRFGFLPGLFEEVLVEEWTYNFGPRRFMRLVRIENGFVAEVEQLGYGFVPY
jgi:hypothetical protein